MQDKNRISQISTFNPAHFDRLKAAEKDHFWFKVRRKWIADKLFSSAPPPARLLEIGCGTGNVSSFLARKGYDVVGCEYYPEATHQAWPGFTSVVGAAERLPFRDSSFDIVGLFDVIEHFDNELNPLNEAVRVLRSGGYLAVTVPAHQRLWSDYDVMSCHRRRYSKKTLRGILHQLPLTVVSLDYFFFFLYLPMRFHRKKQKKDSEYFAISPQANLALNAICNCERLIGKFFSSPTGTSLIAIARKP